MGFLGPSSSGSTGGGFLSGGVTTRRRGRRTLPTPDELRQQVATLEAQRQELGAPQIEEDAPGFLARAIDALSGFNFAIAGATEEIGQGNGLPAATRRFAAEIYSSARSLPLGQILPELGGAEKKAFGEVFESLGFGTTTLGDVVPAMEGTFLGELINTRGTIGLAADVLGDPLTYLSFGLSAVARRTLPKLAQLGAKQGFNKKGLKEFQRASREIRRLEPGLTDDAVDEAARVRVLDLSDSSMFDFGGVKVAGWAIPGTPGVGKATLDILSKPVVSALNRRGRGLAAVRAAEGYWDALKAIGRETFGEFGQLEKLDGAQREAARRLGRKYVEAAPLLLARYHDRVKGSGFMEYLRKNPTRMKPFLTALDQKKLNLLSEAERAPAAELGEFLREIAEEGVAVNLFHADVLDNPSYIFHNYVNLSPEEVSETWRVNAKLSERLGKKHAHARDYETMEQAERISGIRKNVSELARSKGLAVPKEVQLVPDYTLEGFENGLLRYTDWFAKQKTMRVMAEEFRREFGFDKTRWETVVERMLDGAHDHITPAHREWNRVMGFFDRADLGKMAEDAAWNVGKIPAVKARGEGLQDVVKDAVRRLGFIDSKAAQKQFVQELFLRTRSMSQFVNVWDGLERAGKLDLIPSPVRTFEGTAEDALKRFGESARYTSVGGNSIWGKGEAMVPKLIVDYVENAPSRILNTKDFEGFRTAVRFWDKGNNIFKTGVYPFFPSSQFRNMYSNVSLSALRIGWHAINPFLHRHSVGILAGSKGSFLAKTGRVYDYDEVRELIKLHNVKATGRQLVETTGEGAMRIAPEPSLIPQPFTKRGRERALRIIAGVENEARISLFNQSLMDGLSPEEAAADVAEFLFNYNELGPIHRDFIRRIVPFSTFTIKNIRTQVNALRRTPGKVINQLKPFRGRESENDSMVKFEADGLKLRVDSGGRNIRALTGIDFPLRNLDTLWSGGVGATGRRILGSMSPFIKTPVELATSRDLFTNRPLTRAQANTLGLMLDELRTPQWLKNYFGYEKRVDEAGRRRYEVDAVRYQLWIKSYAFSRIMSTSDRQYREYLGDDAVVRSLMDVFTGLRLKDLNLDEQKRRMWLTRKRQTEEVLARRGFFDTFEKRFESRRRGQLQ